jgi:hypothetical protein
MTPIFIGSPEPATIEALLAVVLPTVDPTLRAIPIVFASPDSRGVRAVVWEARGRANGAPVVVILPFRDDLLVKTAMTSGADGCFCIGAPTDELRELLVRLVAKSGATG